MQKTLPSSGLGLTVENLQLAWQDRVVLDGLSFTLPAGGSLAIIGESGCGKTTLLTTLAGFHPVASGQIKWFDDFGPVLLEEHRSSFVWQQLGLFPWKRVKDNLTLPLKLHPEICPAQEVERRVNTLIEQLGLQGLERRFPDELSGGQRQRLALGRSMISRPEVLFMDEPFSALDALLRERLQDRLGQLRQMHPCTVLLVTHDIREAVFLGSHILLLYPRSRGLAPRFMPNPAFTPGALFANREDPVFDETVRCVHKALMQDSPEHQGERL